MRLNLKNLHSLPQAVSVPAYYRRPGGRRIVHIGPGAFHRAHQAVYLDDLLAGEQGTDWDICGAGLLPQDQAIHTALKAQDCLYTVLELTPGNTRARVIGSLMDHLYAPDSPEAVVEKMADPACRIVSLTVTEGGYPVNQWTGEFDDGHPGIRRNLERPHEPVCWLGYLVEALDRRRRRGLPPFTVLSCDNLQHNGDVARKAVLAFADRWDASLATWLESAGAFPNTMVDRITPVTTAAHRTMVAREFGIEDACPVVTEPFRQWIIEDRFVDGRPEWERAGAVMTSDVLPYEKIKLRLLNASHQALCYLGLLMGYEYVHEAVADERIRGFVRRLMDEEVSPLLPPVPGIDLADYKATLIERFSNPAIGDSLLRIGTDASNRIAKFVLPSIAEQIVRGGPTRLLSLAVAGWFRCLAGKDDRGHPIELEDALAGRLTERARRGGADPGPLLAIKEVFGDVLPAAPGFRQNLAEALGALCRNGARAALTALVAR